MIPQVIQSLYLDVLNSFVKLCPLRFPLVFFISPTGTPPVNNPLGLSSSNRVKCEDGSSTNLPVNEFK